MQNEKQTCIARYTLAVDRRFKRDGDQNADFINCVAMGKGGEFAEKYLHKGTKIGIVGHIQTGSYTNKDGNRVYTTDVFVDEHEFVESKATAAANAAAEQPKSKDTSFLDIPDDIAEDVSFS